MNAVIWSIRSAGEDLPLVIGFGLGYGGKVSTPSSYWARAQLAHTLSSLSSV